MEINELKIHNDEIRKQLFELKQKYTIERIELRSKLIEPCQQCPYDGVYRCEACRDMDYAGFNDGDFPYDATDEHDIDNESDFDNK